MFISIFNFLNVNLIQLIDFFNFLMFISIINFLSVDLIKLINFSNFFDVYFDYYHLFH